jgi:hypothetical protein
LINDAAVSMSESISDASTLTEPVSSQATSFTAINPLAVATDAVVASVNNRARSLWLMSSGIAFSLYKTTCSGLLLLIRDRDYPPNGAFPKRKNTS